MFAATFLLALQLSLAQDHASLFAAGVAAYGKNDLEAAQKEFLSLVAKERDNPEALYNLGLISQERNQVGLALGSWRRALVLNPNFKQARAALKLSSENPVASAAVGFSGILESVRGEIERRWPLDFSLFGLLFGLVVFSAMLVHHRALNARAFQVGEEPVPYSNRIWMAVAIILLTGTLSALQLYAFLNPRATVVTVGAQLRTGPGTENSSITGISEGSEVAPLQVERDWVLAETPDGRQGWLEKKELLQTSGYALW